MNELTPLECPHCHSRGETSQELRPGIIIRCPSCRQPFAYQPGTDRGHSAEDTHEGPLSGQVRGPRMGGLAVFDQKELVEQVSGASVAQVLAESRKVEKRRRLIGVCVFGISVITGLVLMWLPGSGSQARPAKVLSPYATKALAIALARDGVREEDEAGPSGDRPLRIRSPEIVKLIGEQRDLLTKCAESMPTDLEGQRLLDQATEWYKEDVLGIWMDCRSTAQMLAMAKPPIEEDPRRILEGAVEVMKRLKIRPNRDQSIRQFGSLYEFYRKNAPCRAQIVGQSSHQEAVDCLVENRKFGE